MENVETPGYSTPTTFPISSPPEGDAIYIDEDEDHVRAEMGNGVRFDAGPDEAKQGIADGFAGCILTEAVITYDHKPIRTGIVTHFPPTPKGLKGTVDYYKKKIEEDPDLKNGKFYELRIFDWKDKQDSNKFEDALQLCNEIFRAGICVTDTIDQIAFTYHERAGDRGLYLNFTFGDVTSEFLGQDVPMKSNLLPLPEPSVGSSRSPDQGQMISPRVSAPAASPLRINDEVKRKNTLVRELYGGFLERRFQKEWYRQALVTALYRKSGPFKRADEVYFNT